LKVLCKRDVRSRDRDETETFETETTTLTWWSTSRSLSCCVKSSYCNLTFSVDSDTECVILLMNSVIIHHFGNIAVKERVH